MQPNFFHEDSCLLPRNIVSVIASSTSDLALVVHAGEGTAQVEIATLEAKVEALQADNRILKNLVASVGNDKTAGDINFPGNITIRAVLSELEATHKVYNTTELLENILHFVLIRDLLLRIQLVGRAHRHLIQTSPELCRKLFLDSDPSSPPTAFPFRIKSQTDDIHRLYYSWNEGCCHVVMNLSRSKITRIESSPGLLQLCMAQPAPQRITAFGGICREPRTDILIVSREDGVRFGNLMQVPRQLLHEHSDETDRWIKFRAEQQDPPALDLS